MRLTSDIQVPPRECARHPQTGSTHSGPAGSQWSDAPTCASAGGAAAPRERRRQRAPAARLAARGQHAARGSNAEGPQGAREMHALMGKEVGA